MQSYKTLLGQASASITEKKSEFIALAAHTETEQEALAILETVRAQHRTASHNVYAYQLQQNARQRYSDDGEPAKTAGLPVLSVIAHAEITNCLVVVTRYFGGTLLGTGGLVRAYTQAAQAALKAVTIVTISLCVTLVFAVEYPLYEQAMRILAQEGAKWEEPAFSETIQITATQLAGKEDSLLQKLKELTRGAVHIDVSPPYYLPF